MMRIHYDDRSLVTSTEVADALVVYAKAVAHMDSTATVEIPVLEDNGDIAIHALMLTASTSLETIEIDGDVSGEAERFPLPDFQAVGGKAVAVSADEIEEISFPIA